MLFIGIMFAIGVFVLSPDLFHFQNVNIIEVNEFLKTAVAIVITYYIGFFIDRIGSLCVEKVLKNKNHPDDRSFVSQKIQMNWRNYDDYQKAEKNGENIKTLARDRIFNIDYFGSGCW